MAKAGISDCSINFVSCEPAPAGGNVRLVAALAKDVPILYNSVVQEVRYCQYGVAVRTATHEFRGECLPATLTALHPEGLALMFAMVGSCAPSQSILGFSVQETYQEEA